MLRSYFKNASILGTTEILLRMKGLILVPLLTKYFGTVNYGIWAQVSILVSLLGPMAVLGTDAAAVRYLPGADKSEKQRGLTTILVSVILASLGIAIVLWILDRTLAIAFFNGIENARYIKLCGFVITVTLLLNLLRTWYTIQDSAKSLMLISIVQAAVGVGAVVCVITLNYGIYELVLLTSILEGVICAALLFHIALRFGLSKPRWELLKQYVRFGLPLLPIGYTMWVLNASDRIFLTHYGTLADVGIYSVAYNLGHLFIPLFVRPFQVMYPARASELYNKGDLKNLDRLFRYSSKASLVLVIPAMTGFSVLAVPIFRYLTTEDFLPGAHLVPLIALGYTFHIFGYYFDITMRLVDKPAWVTINRAVAATVNILLNFLLIPQWGIAGAAVSTTLSFGLNMFLSMWKGLQHIPLTIEWKFILKVAFASALMGLAVSLLPSTGLLHLAICILVGASVYALGMFILGAFSPEEKTFLLNLIKHPTNQPIAKPAGEL